MGKRQTQKVHDIYKENLRYVLDEVELLSNNIEASKSVITSDHGQALGESFCYDHIPGMNQHVMRAVPWAEFQSTDKSTIQPEEYDDIKTKNATRDQLKALGYR
jgi:hypothetical protein